MTETMDQIFKLFIVEITLYNFISNLEIVFPGRSYFRNGKLVSSSCQNWQMLLYKFCIFSDDL